VMRFVIGEWWRDEPLGGRGAYIALKALQMVSNAKKGT
jgi:hypothetical protein